MNAIIRSSFVMGLVTCSALALSQGCASSDDDDTKPAGGNTGGATGGSTAPAANQITFTDGKASGLMTGYGWMALGVKDSISSPTCGGTPITKYAPCNTTTTWSSKNALCATGEIPKLPDSAVQSDYDDNWGILIGFDNNESSTGNIGKVFSTIDVSVSGSPTTGLRVLVNKEGEATSYCADYAGKPIALSKFNTACWEPAKGKDLTEFDKITKVGVQVSSTATAAIKVDNLCLNSVTFN